MTVSPTISGRRFAACTRTATDAPLPHGVSGGPAAQVPTTCAATSFPP